MTDQQFKLAGEFPPATVEAWRELAEAGLNGADFDRKLVTAVADGFRIKPLYTRDDLDDSGRSIHEAMIASSNRKSVGEDEKSGWDIRQLHAHPDPVATNEAILEDLENGANSVLLRLDAGARSGGEPSAADAGEGGVMLYGRNDMARALEGVYSSLAPVALDAGAAAVPAAALLAASVQEEAVEALLAFNIDPIGTLARSGSLPQSVEAALEELGRTAADAAQAFPRASVADVDSACWYNAGATDGSELAIALATGLAYLRAMTGAGLPIEQAAERLTFTAAVGTDFFTGIAKLRALRLMWRRVLEASGAGNARVTVHATAAEHVLSKVDPWVNMLRTTVTSFAGGVGGADSVVCLPYDHLLGLPDDFSRRMARNTQIILEEESNVHRVLDPAGGSWYVESLTGELARVAWDEFQAIEREGGIVGKVLDGSLVEETAARWKQRQKRLATRKDALTGVSEFPNIDEEGVATEQPDLAALRQQAAARQTRSDAAIGKTFSELVAAAEAGASVKQLFDALYGEASPVTVAALQPHRLAEDFEALRERAAQHAASSGAAPAVFLANIGRVAEHTARASFARNFFEAGGVKGLGNDGFADAEAAAAAFAGSGAGIAVICGSDEQYASQAEEIARALKAKGARRVYLAGRGGDKAEAYAAAGIDDYVFMGADVLAICGAALDQLGVK